MQPHDLIFKMVFIIIKRPLKNVHFRSLRLSVQGQGRRRF